MNKQVEEFIEAVKDNGRKVWSGFTDKEFVDDLLFVNEYEDGDVTISDNYERFFDIVYRVTSDGQWSYRRMWLESSEWQPYTFEQAMNDASIMYTG